ncbi:hypothetical protein, partial [Aggregatibacter actinomycetemcomitans]
MIRLFIFIIFFLFSLLANASCFTEREYNELVLKSLPDSNDDYYDKYPYGVIHNMASCSESNELSHLVCSDLKLKKSLLLLSIGEIYAYENAMHTPVADYSTYNNDFKDWLNNLVKAEKSKDIALRKLCYVIRNRLSDDFGGDFSYTPNVYEVIFSKSNPNGVVVDSLSSRFYLGKSCDASNSIKEKGRWYKDKDQFVVELGDSKYRFNYDEKVFSLH